MASSNMDWCKTRALEYVERGDAAQAFASFVSDLGKNDDTQDLLRNPAFPSLLAVGQKAAADGDVRAMRDWIAGF